MDKLYSVPRRLSSDAEDRNSESTRNIGKRYLVNKLNYINFQDRTILINFKHKRYNTIISLQATPLPCAGERLECVWTEFQDPGTLRSHTLHNLLIAGDRKCLMVDPEVISINEKGISLKLPETCSELIARKMKRHTSTGIQVLITQNSAILNGTLLDYSSMAFRTQVTTASSQVFQWINFEAPVSLHLYSVHELLYSGECMIIRNSLDQTTGVFVLAAVNDRFQRYKPKQFRSTRYTLHPSPNMIFIHPFTGKTSNLKTRDLSGSGFSVEENAESSMLFAGLILPELELSFAHNFPDYLPGSGSL